MQLLEQLTATPSVPGREDRIRQFIHNRVAALFDDISTDNMGNLIGYRKPRPNGEPVEPDANTLKVMLAAHMDQIGFLVKFIDDKGYIRVNPVGGFDTRNLFARNATVCTADEDLPAVMNPAGKPVHIATDEERKKVPEIHEFYLDLGLDADIVKQKVQIGDMVVLHAPFRTLGNAVAAQCLDNRIGCWALIRAIENLQNHNCAVYAVWTVQEEVGLRGAGPAAFGIEPHIGLSCDTTLCCDIPDTPDHQQVTKFGEGICLKIMDSSTITDIKLVEQIEKVADDNNIPHQRGLLPRGGQDGAMIQRSRAGIRTAVFACPVRYIHTVTEMAHQTDLDAYHRLLTAYLSSV